MGGLVFKNTHEVLRLSTKEYFEYVDKIKILLDSLCIELDNYYIVRAIKEKDSYGDMDVVINFDFISKKRIEHSLEERGYPVSTNGDVVSFLFENFQIDLIFVPDKSFKYACNYFNWNDVGNLVGRLAKQYGFKHGWQGLYYVQRDHNRVLKEHLLSTDYLDIINIMGLDKYQLFRGFDTYTQMFDWVIASPKFISHIFKLENLNHTNRVRDRKRKTYNMFLKHLSLKNLYDTEIPERLTDKQKLDSVYHYFPHIRKEIEEIDKQIERDHFVKSKFNGALVTELTGLVGKDLGTFIQMFKSKYNQDWIYNTEDYEIQLLIKKLYQNWQS